ncbi:MAG TPA: DMT family transporter [Buttiauxella sp.]|jgi:drug/metabolite transporter (DMT)-like permease
MRKNIDLTAFLLMIVICAVWGVQQVAMKSVASEISPALQVSVRSGVAALLIFLIFNRRDNIIGRLAESHIWLPALAVGGLFALEFWLVVTGIKMTSASHMTLFLYTAPLFSAAGLPFFIRAEALSRRQWWGIVVAFIGIGIALLLTKTTENDASWSLAGDLLGLAAGMSWGISSIIIRCSALSQIPSSCTLFYQLMVASAALLLIAPLTGQTTFIITSASLGSLVFQTVIVAFMSYLAWFTLLRYYQVSTLGTLVLMTPVMGIAAGAYFLSERLQTGFIAGSALILAGLVCVCFRRKKGG